MATCPQCRKKYVPAIQERDPTFSYGLFLWRGGELIQNVWPDATASEREQLQTGMCSSECFTAFLGGPTP
jgi:hypothetical protein